MLKMTPDTEDPSSTLPPGNANGSSHHKNGKDKEKPSGFTNWLKTALKIKPGSDNLREALEEYIEELEESETTSIDSHERALIANVLKMQDLTVVDVMIPRADIVGIDVETSQGELMEMLAERQFSRLPVYKETLDNVIGTIHIKDIMAHMATGKPVNIQSLVREVPIVSPAMPVLDLLLQMRQTRKHMALVVDEFGGIDGLITIGDVVEAITGEIDDEFDPGTQPEIEEKPDGSILADGRVDIDEFEEEVGEFLNEEEREEIDTIGGLVFSLAGRVPARGEVLQHDSGMVFEIVEADPRRVNKVRVKNIPKAVSSG